MDFSKQFIKEEVVRLIRAYFLRRHFHEIETPTLLPQVPLEPGLYPFKTHWYQRQLDFYLAVSPESSLKKLLSNGIGNCFAISKSFRDLEDIGPTHNLEFSMLEWYELGKNYRNVALTTEKLINNTNLGIHKYLHRRATNILSYQRRQIDLTPPWHRFSLVDLFQQFVHFDLTRNLTFDQLKKSATQHHYHVDDFTTWEQIFSYLMITCIEPNLPADKPVFIFDYPSQMTPLCQPCSDNPDFAQRFELYIAGMEIGNAYTELTSSSTLEANFKKEADFRQKHHLPTHPYDQELVTALNHFPACAGPAIGVDRLAMLFSNAATIDEVLYFPTSKLIK